MPREVWYHCTCGHVGWIIRDATRHGQDHSRLGNQAEICAFSKVMPTGMSDTLCHAFTFP